jgi:hypothetical protein
MEEQIEVHERIKGLEVSVEEIKTNHLPHIQAKVDKIDERIWYILGTIILGFIISIVSFLIFK